MRGCSPARRMAEPPQQQRRSIGAIALISLGLLILVPSGLCTGLVGIAGLISGGGNFQDALQLLEMVLGFGAVPIVIGYLILRKGLKMARG